jgi:hypothetical protein
LISKSVFIRPPPPFGRHLQRQISSLAFFPAYFL